MDSESDSPAESDFQCPKMAPNLRVPTSLVTWRPGSPASPLARRPQVEARAATPAQAAGSLRSSLETRPGQQNCRDRRRRAGGFQVTATQEPRSGPSQ